MKQLFILFVLGITMFVSCRNDRETPETIVKTPSAVLTDNNSSYSFKRGKENLVLELYDELVDKTPSLKVLEKNYRQLNASKEDSLKQFSEFDGNNKSYYADAINFTNSIKDSVLRLKMKQMLEDSKKIYDTSVSKHHAILNSIDVKTAKLKDLRAMLVIERTLQMMEQYQKESIPTTKSPEGYAKEVDKMTNQVNKELSKKK